MIKLTKNYFFLFTLVLFTGCIKTEGQGGRAKIKGKITGTFYYDDQLTQLNGSGVLANENVYIVYGTADTYFDDDIKTSYDGSYEFNYLRPGTYTIFAYENCFPCAGLERANIIDTVVISGKDEIVDLGTINIKKKV